ncbi:hypothetical protein [Tengunoibacter tsumagoiensis]|nr:hypothetical protein [Tengunoibacter tsumagoiensis]
MPTKSKPFYIQFARFISTIFSPATISLPLILLVAFYHPNPAALQYAGVTLLFLSIGPLLYILIGVSTGQFTDIDVSDRSQRTGPFLFIIGSSLVGALILSFANGPKDLITILVLTALTSALMMIITFWWKISMHAASIAAVSTMLTMLYGVVILPAFLLVILVDWSRVVLKRHTLGQVIAGSSLGIIMTAVTLLIRGV